MSGIKGVVILTRFDFIENSYGKDALKAFQTKVQPGGGHLLRQPVVISKDYPESILKTIDEQMLSDFFNNEIQAFRSLGHWNAENVLPKYFQIYLDNKDTVGFLEQMVRMRPILIGLGEMHISAFAPRSYGIRISYGQPYLESVKLSELGFLEKGLLLCGAEHVNCSELDASDVAIEYQLDWD